MACVGRHRLGLTAGELQLDGIDIVQQCVADRSDHLERLILKRLGDRDLHGPMRNDVLRHRGVGNQPARVGDPGFEVIGAETRSDLTQVGAIDNLFASARLELADRMALDARRGLVAS